MLCTHACTLVLTRCADPAECAISLAPGYLAALHRVSWVTRCFAGSCEHFVWPLVSSCPPAFSITYQYTVSSCIPALIWSPAGCTGAINGAQQACQNAVSTHPSFAWYSSLVSLKWVALDTPKHCKAQRRLAQLSGHGFK
jgi:hypothetical protein